MTNKNSVWDQMARDVDTVLTDVRSGLAWQRIAGPSPESTAITAEGPTFKIMCVSWESEDETHWHGVVTVMLPHICIINLPPDTAKEIWKIATSSFN